MVMRTMILQRIMLVLFICMSAEIIAAENSSVEEVPDYSAMTDIQLVRYMLRVQEGPLTTISNFPKSLEVLSSEYNFMIIGRVIDIALNREEIIENIKQGTICALYRDIKILVSHQYPVDPPFELITIRDKNPKRIAGLNHDVFLEKGKEYFIFFNRTLEDPSLGNDRIPYFAWNDRDTGRVVCVFEMEDDIRFSISLPHDYAWSHLVNYRELLAGRGIPITVERLRNDLKHGSSDDVLYALVQMERQKNGFDLSQTAMDRFEKDLSAWMYQRTLDYQVMIIVALNAFKKHPSVDVFERMFSLLFETDIPLSYSEIYTIMFEFASVIEVSDKHFYLEKMISMLEEKGLSRLRQIILTNASFSEYPRLREWAKDLIDKEELNKTPVKPQ